MNKIEKQAFELISRTGTEIVFRGWPDFLVVHKTKTGKLKVKLIEIKLEREKSNGTFSRDCLSPGQTYMFEMLRRIGFEIEIMYVRRWLKPRPQKTITIVNFDKLYEPKWDEHMKAARQRFQDSVNSHLQPSYRLVNRKPKITSL